LPWADAACSRIVAQLALHRLVDQRRQHRVDAHEYLFRQSHLHPSATALERLDDRRGHCLGRILGNIQCRVHRARCGAVHAGARAAWRHPQQARALAADLARQCLGEGAQATLGGAVSGEARVSDLTQRGADQHQRALPVRRQARQQGVGQQHRRDQIGGDQLLDLARAHLLEQAEIGRPRRSTRRCRCRRPRRQIRPTRRARQRWTDPPATSACPPAGSREQRVHALRIAAVHAQARAAICSQPRQRAADATGRAGDQDAAALEVHAASASFGADVRMDSKTWP
jgi:hypothetical protein